MATKEAAVKAALTVINKLDGRGYNVDDEADAMKTEILDNDRRYCCAVGTYDTKGPTLDSG